MDLVNNVEGTAFFQFDTDAIGGIKDLKLISSSGSSTLDSEARRLIYNIPRQRIPNTTQKISINFRLADNKIYRIDEIEEKPEFHGGDAEIQKFILKNLQFPLEYADSSISGTIICGVIIEKDGTINIVEILRSVDYLIDAEAMRVIKRMPKWTAGKKDGKPVRVYFMIPVRIKLSM